MKWAVWVAIALCLALQADAAKKKPIRRRELIAETGPSDEQIWDSGLLEKTVSPASLYEKARTYYQDTSIKKFQGPVLAYVTPWHKAGYEYAVKFRGKLTHVSPVWYQLRYGQVTKDGPKEWVLQGGHEFNQTWMDEVKEGVAEGRERVRVVPRVIVELADPQDHVTLVNEPSKAIEALVTEVVAKGYDGIVLEVWMAWVQINGIENDAFRGAAYDFVADLARVLHKAPGRRRALILAVPPAIPSGYGRPYTRRDTFDALKDHVDFWSIMTYDWGVGQGAQPNAPLSWLEANAKLITEGEMGSDAGSVLARPEQALLGLNFYGYDYSLKNPAAPSAIVANTYLALLAKHQPILEWEQQHDEHALEYTATDGVHKVYFPTPRSIQMRLEAAQRAGMGVSIWELGQGVERFFDLL